MRINDLSVENLVLSRAEKADLLASWPTHVLVQALNDRRDKQLVAAIVERATDAQLLAGIKAKLMRCPGMALASQVYEMAERLVAKRRGVA